jgi:hypothetical protein
MFPRLSSRRRHVTCRTHSVLPNLEHLEQRWVPSFAPAVSYAAGDVPSAVAVGDFNGDGKQDLAVANETTTHFNGSGTVSILLGKGDGTFAPAANHVAGTDPRSVAVGDFNGDGKLDLAVANFFSESVSILVGKGDGTFATPVNYSVGGEPTSVAVGDFNGDGKQDLAVVNSKVFSAVDDVPVSGSSNVSVLVGKGDGTFAPAVNYAAGEDPNSVAVGDFNGDGKRDLAVANFVSGNVSILVGQGDGTFATPVNYPVGSEPTSVAVGDFNGDGKQDLAVATSGNVSVLVGKGDGTFAPAANYAAGGTSVAVGDFNGDGKQDLATSGVSVLLGVASPSATVATCDPGTATWYLRNSTSAGFPDIAPFPYGLPGWLPVVGDWDGDGTATVGVFDPSTATWYLRNSNSAGAPDIAPFQYGGPGWIPVVGDWSHTGHTGIGVFDPATGTWYLRNEDSAGTPDAGTFRYGGAGWLPVVGDWDGNGTATVGVVDPASETWYLRNENSAGAPDAATPFQYGLPGWTPIAGDWDGDGRAGIGVYYGTAFYLRNAADAGLPDIAPFPYGLYGWTPVAGAWTAPAATTQAAAASRGVSDHLAADLLATGVRRTPALDQVFASFRKGKEAATDSSGVNDTVG